MRCNACWRELEGQAISTPCGHLLCSEDLSKILSNDAACPICDQVLSESRMKPVDINPTDEWINMAMAGVSPQILMQSAYKSVMFYIGQKELEMQYKMERIVAQCRQKCEAMQEKFSEKLEQVHTAYQKMAQTCQMMEQEIESLSKDKQELQEKFSEKSRQKRKLDEMYDELMREHEILKRQATVPARNKSNSLPKSAAKVMGRRDAIWKGMSGPRPVVWSARTPGPRRVVWPATNNGSNSSGFDISCSQPKRPASAQPAFGAAVATPLRNMIFSPIKQPRNLTQLFPS